MKRELIPMTNDEMRYKAPSIFAEAPKHDVSNRYQFVPTVDMIQLLNREGWLVHEVKESRANKSENYGFTNHIVRMFRPELILNGETIESVIINSHNRTSTYQMMMGVYRMICENGMIVGDTFNQISIKHIGDQAEQIVNASYQVIESAPLVADNISVMKDIELDNNEQKLLAESVLMIEHDQAELETMKVNPESLLRSRRWEDRLDTSLWTTFNKVQENYMKGNFKFSKVDDNGREHRRKSRQIKNIDRDIKFNRALWHLTETMKNLKVK